VLDHSLLVRRFKKARDTAGVRAMRFHDLPHSFATAVAGAAVPLRTLRQWLGHRAFATTLIYADYCPTPLKSELVERAFAPVEAAEPPEN
jgi:integrase